MSKKSILQSDKECFMCGTTYNKELLMRKKALKKYVRLLRRQPLWKKLL